MLTPDEFTKRAKALVGLPDGSGRASRVASSQGLTETEHGWDGDSALLFHAARDETAALTDEIAKVEREIDERVAGLYGV